MKLNKTTRFFIVYSLYFVIALSVYVLFYFHIERVQERIVNTQVKIAQLKDQNDKTTNLKDTLVTTTDQREQLTNFFVDGDFIIEFLETIEGMGATANVEVDVKGLNDSKTENDEIKELNLTIDFSGSLSGTHHFLVLLESIPIKMTIDTFSLRESRSQSVDEEGNSVEASSWNGTVSVRTLQLDT